MKTKQLLAIVIIFSSHCAFGMEKQVRAWDIERSGEEYEKKIYIFSAETPEEKVRFLLKEAQQSNFIANQINDIGLENINPKKGLAINSEIINPKIFMNICLALKENYHSNSSFNYLKGLDLDDLILCDDAINQLDLKPKHLSISNQVSQKISDAVHVELKNNKTPTIDNYKKFEHIQHPLTISKVCRAFVKNEKLDSPILQPYGNFLINNKTEKIPNAKEGRLFYFDREKNLEIYFANTTNTSENFRLFDPHINYFFNKIIIKKNGVITEKTLASRCILLSTTLQVNDQGSFIFIMQRGEMPSISINIFDARNNTFISLPNKWKTCTFASNDTVYVSDNLYRLFTIKIDGLSHENNQLMIADSHIRKLKGPGIIGATRCEKTKTVIFYTKRDIIIKTAEMENFEILDILDPDSEIKQAFISRCGTFLFVKTTHSTIQIYNLLSKDHALLSPSVNRDYCGYENLFLWSPTWTQDDALLILNGEGKLENSPTQSLYIFTNTDTGNSWAVERKGTIAQISSDGKQAIEESAGIFGINTYRTTLVDKNIEDTIKFLNPNNQDLTNANLIGIALLYHIIKHCNADISKLDPSLLALYEKYIPLAVKNVLNKDIGPVGQSTSWLSSLLPSWFPSRQSFTVKNISDKLYQYRRGLLGTAATALGVAAAYKYWTKGQK